MEAPEKIYLTEDKSLKEWYRTKQVGFNSIEYTRTDAFIEKAAEWILRNGSYYIAFEQGQPCIDKEFVEQFKNHMKGE